MTTVEKGARCHRCGHYETSALYALLNYAHCPACDKHTRWRHPDTGVALLAVGNDGVTEDVPQPGDGARVVVTFGLQPI